MKFAILLVVSCCAFSAHAMSLGEIHALVPRGVFSFSPGGALLEDGRPQKMGAVNKLVSSVVELARGLIRGWQPALHGIYEYLVPGLTALFQALDIYPCKPQTSLELLLWDALEFVNGPLRSNLGIPYLRLCDPTKSRPPSDEQREKISHGQLAQGNFDDTYYKPEGGSKADDIDFGGPAAPDALDGDEGEEGGEEPEEAGEAPEPEGEEDTPAPEDSHV